MTSGFAIVFPGQGSQSVGMLNSFVSTYGSAIQPLFNEASQVLGYDLWTLIQEGPETELNKTEVTQPALLAASVAIWQLWRKKQGPLPAMMAGHSLGEYTALVCANALEFSDAIALVALRGQLMQAAVPEGLGAMAAIVGLSNEVIAELCQQVTAQGVVVPANYNAIGQVVISGEKHAVDAVVEMAKQQGAKLAKVLPVSVPSHSPLMKPAAEALAKAIDALTLKSPQIPILHNVNVDVESNPEQIKQLLIEQLYQPVRWVETIQRFVKEGHTTIVECGPGKVLTGLSKRIDASCQGIALTPCDAFEAALEEITVS